MTIASDLTDLFSALEEEGMTVALTYFPPAGGASIIAQVVFDAPGSVAALGDASVIVTDPTITYPSTVLTGLAGGDEITVDGTDYTVREVVQLDDGKVMQARLARMD